MFDIVNVTKTVSSPDTGSKESYKIELVGTEDSPMSGVHLFAFVPTNRPIESEQGIKAQVYLKAFTERRDI